MIILNKSNRVSYCFFEQFMVETLKEKATLITKYFWLKNKYIRYRGLDYIHLHIHILFSLFCRNGCIPLTPTHTFETIFNRYCP